LPGRGYLREHGAARGPGDDEIGGTRVLAVLQDFYGAMAQISFTLLGLWWVVVQFKYADFMRDRRRRIQTYDTSLYFVLPGIMSLISLLTTTGLLWRITFTTAAILGAVEAVFLLATTRRAQGSRVWRSAHYAGVALYVLVALFAVFPKVVEDLGLHLKTLQIEGLFLALIIFLGVQSSWIQFAQTDHATGGRREFLP
jgi:hypothetical protein